MSHRSIKLTDELYKYLCDISLRENEVQKKLRKETSKLEFAQMQISPEQGQFFTFLVKLLGAKRIIEVGVFTGYSSLCMALGLDDIGELIACDISEEYTDIAKKYWKEAGVSDKIKLFLAPATETLQMLIDQREINTFDLAFIDADKINYKNYYELCLKLVKKNGLILVDNVLWGGSVIDNFNQDADTIAIRNFNNFLKSDKRVDICMIPVGDGVMFIRKK